MHDQPNDEPRRYPLDPEWADRVLDEYAREGEQLDDEQVGIVRTEERLREVMTLHIDRVVDLLSDDRDVLDLLRGELLDDDEAVDELRRRLRWHAARHEADR